MDTVQLRRINLRNVIDATGMTDAAFCERHSLNPSHISQLVTGHGSFGERAARNLEKKIGLMHLYLDMEHQSGQQNQSSQPKYKPQNMNFIPPVDLTHSENPRQTPVLSWVQGGDFTFVLAADLSNAIDWIPFDKRAGENGFALIVKGVSMEPDFKPDEYIYVNPTYQIDELHTGALVVMACDGDTEATFKRLISEDDGYYLQPLNPNWRPQLIEVDHTCRLVGKVVGKYTRF